MKNKHFWRVAQMGLLALAASISTLAQNPTQKKLTGEINSYTPQLTTSTGGTIGPYEVRGPWTLTLLPDSGKANFTAALNMELSDGWVITLNGGNFDPSARGAHTHHIALVNGAVAPITGGFSVTGTATITLNGKTAPVSPAPLEIDITGSTLIAYSNITLTFGVPASNHFGSEALSGIVRRVNK